MCEGLECPAMQLWKDWQMGGRRTEATLNARHQKNHHGGGIKHCLKWY